MFFNWHRQPNIDFRGIRVQSVGVQSISASLYCVLRWDSLQCNLTVPVSTLECNWVQGNFQWSVMKCWGWQSNTHSGGWGGGKSIVLISLCHDNQKYALTWWLNLKYLKLNRPSCWVLQIYVSRLVIKSRSTCKRNRDFYQRPFCTTETIV